MQVVIYDPKTPEGMNSDLVMNLICEFQKIENTYGNKHYVRIAGDGMENIYDIRYDNSFRSNKKEQWLTDWAYNYWTGENGAYAIKKLTIEKI